MRDTRDGDQRHVERGDHEGNARPPSQGRFLFMPDNNVNGGFLLHATPSAPGAPCRDSEHRGDADRQIATDLPARGGDQRKVFHHQRAQRSYSTSEKSATTSTRRRQQLSS